jgi:pyruvate-formate lyase-activating enzyme
MIKDQLQNNTYKINFTGGEPLIQYEAVKDLAKFIKEELGLRTYIESSCYDVNRFNKIISYIDICKVEFKTKDSQAVDIKHYRYLLNNEIECLKTAIENKKITFIKIVVSNSTTINEFKELVEVIFNTIKSEELAGFIIQPTNNINEPTVDRLLQFYDLIYPRYNEVRIIPQLHKIIGAR